MGEVPSGPLGSTATRRLARGPPVTRQSTTPDAWGRHASGCSPGAGAVGARLARAAGWIGMIALRILGRRLAAHIGQPVQK